MSWSVAVGHGNRRHPFSSFLRTLIPKSSNIGNRASLVVLVTTVLSLTRLSVHDAIDPFAVSGGGVAVEGIGRDSKSIIVIINASHNQQDLHQVSTLSSLRDVLKRVRDLCEGRGVVCPRSSDVGW